MHIKIIFVTHILGAELIGPDVIIQGRKPKISCQAHHYKPKVLEKGQLIYSLGHPKDPHPGPVQSLSRERLVSSFANNGNTLSHSVGYASFTDAH
jgi:hypothetical protein